MRIDRAPPSSGVALVEQLIHGHADEIGIAEELRAIEKHAPVRLRDEVDRIRGVAAGLREVEAFQYVERLDERDAARGGRRCADDGEVAVGALHGRPVLHLVAREVAGSDEAAAALHVRSDLARHLTGIEIIGLLSDAFERPRKDGLLEEIALLPALAIVLEDAPRRGELRKSTVARHRAGFSPAQGISVAGEPDGRGHDPREAELAEAPLRLHEPLDGARHA